METPNKSGNPADGLLWLGLGALVGVAAALLLAPEKGAQTRRKLAGHVEKGRKNLYESGNEVIDRGRELFEKGRGIAQETAEMFERGRRMAEQDFDEQVIERELEHHFNQGT